MNKKAANIILITLTSVVWSLVFYKYFIKKAESNLETGASSLVVNQKIDFNIEKDVFNLTLNDRDPFKVSKNFKRKTNHKDKTKQRFVKPVTAKKNWPKIEYYGFIKGNNNNTKLAILKINNKIYRKRENQEIQELKIKKAYSDSILIAFGKALKTIKKK